MTEAVEIEVCDAQLGLDDMVAVLGRTGLNVGAVPADMHQPDLLPALALTEQIVLVGEVVQVVPSDAQTVAALPGVLPLEERPDDVVQRDHAGRLILRACEAPAAEVVNPLDLPVYGKDAVLQVDVVPGQAEHLAETQTAVVCQHHRQMAGMPLRKARENLLKVLTEDRITDHVTLIPAFPRSGQVDVLRRAVLDPPAPLCEMHRVADDAQQVRQRIATETLIVHVVDELLDVLRFDGGEAVFPKRRADVKLDALCVSGAGGFFAFDGDVVCQPRVKAVGVAHLRGRKHGPACIYSVYALLPAAMASCLVAKPLF